MFIWEQLRLSKIIVPLMWKNEFANQISRSVDPVNWFLYGVDISLKLILGMIKNYFLLNKYKVLMQTFKH